MISNCYSITMEYPILLEDAVDIERSEERECELCEFKNGTIYDIEYYKDNEEKVIAVCELCQSTIIYDKCKMYRTIFLKSDLSQKQIIQHPTKYYKQTGYKPSPPVLDPNVKKLTVSSPTLKMLACKDEKIIRDNIVQFFNPEYVLTKLIKRNVFAIASKKTHGFDVNKKYWDDVTKLDTYDIPPLDTKNLDSEKINALITEAKNNLCIKVKLAQKLA